MTRNSSAGSVNNCCGLVGNNTRHRLDAASLQIESYLPASNTFGSGKLALLRRAENCPERKILFDFQQTLVSKLGKAPMFGPMFWPIFMVILKELNLLEK